MSLAKAAKETKEEGEILSANESNIGERVLDLVSFLFLRSLRPLRETFSSR